MSAAPVTIQACAVCFGDPAAAETVGAGWAILSLLALTLAVLASFALFFLQLGRRARNAAARGTGGEAR